jgi:ApaG protein
MSRVPFFYAATGGIRVTVQPGFLEGRSRPDIGQYVFAYRVRVENVGDDTVQLLRRRWHIHDSIGEDLAVAGEGVVGQQPVLGPGAVHEYQSYCVLKSPNGYMEGDYTFVRDDGTEITARIPRFTLSVEVPADPH